MQQSISREIAHKKSSKIKPFPLSSSLDIRNSADGEKAAKLSFSSKRFHACNLCCFFTVNVRLIEKKKRKYLGRSGIRHDDDDDDDYYYNVAVRKTRQCLIELYNQSIAMHDVLEQRHLSSLRLILV